MRERHREAQDTDVFQKENKFISIQQLLFLFTTFIRRVFYLLFVVGLAVGHFVSQNENKEVLL